MVKKKYSDTGEIPEMEETADVVEDLESAPIADEPKEEASPVEAPKVVKPSIALRVFLQICGKKADQTAGFSSYAIDTSFLFDKTKNNPVNHCVLAIRILEDAGVSSEAIDIICSHAWGSECGGGNVANKKRTRNIEHALVAAETVTGLVYAAALMNPDKQLADLKVKSLKKKYKSKAFARNCNREFIAEIENTGLELNGFFDIAIKAMQEIRDELGL